MAVTVKTLATLFLLVVLQPAVEVRAEYCNGERCLYGCCGIFLDRCCRVDEGSILSHDSDSDMPQVSTTISSISAGIIVAIVIGSVAFLAAIITCIVCLVRTYSRRSPPVVYSHYSVPGTTVVNTATMSPGTAYPYPQAQPYPTAHLYDPRAALPYPTQQTAQSNPAFSPEHGQQPPAYTSKRTDV